jgi:hypothetical protein
MSRGTPLIENRITETDVKLTSQVDRNRPRVATKKETRIEGSERVRLSRVESRARSRSVPQG